MHGKIRQSSAEAAKAGAWRDQLWAKITLREREEREVKIEREGLREWVRQMGVMR